jgi:DNA-binding MarR family transcriptional regulator
MQPLPMTIDADPTDDCALEVLDAVPPVIWFIRREIRAYRKGLSLPQFRALAVIHRRPSASLSVVADHLGVSLPTASRVVNGLVEQGLLARKACAEDRRQLSLVIAPAGQTVLHTAWSATQDRLTDQLRSLSPGQRRSIAQAMKALKEVFGAMGLTEGMIAQELKRA